MFGFALLFARRLYPFGLENSLDLIIKTPFKTVGYLVFPVFGIHVAIVMDGLAVLNRKIVNR
jgi:hypothetical protein